jgi:hypothetical protein
LFQSNLDLPLNTKSVHNYATELLVKFGKSLGLWCLELGIFVPHRQNKTPVPNSSTRDNLSF